MYRLIGILVVLALLGDCAVISAENQHRLQRGYNNNNKNGGYGSYGEGTHGQSGYGQSSYGQGGYGNSDERDSHSRDGCSDNEDGGRSDSGESGGYRRQASEHRHTPSSRSLVRTFPAASAAAASNQKHNM